MASSDTTPCTDLERTVTVINFGDRLAALRKQRGLTQQAVADALTAHVIQIHRYEAGTGQPPEHLASGCARKPSTSSSTTSRPLVLAMILCTPLRHQVRQLNAG